MPPPIVDERTVLDGRALRVFFRSPVSLLVCQIEASAGEVAKSAPLLPIGGEYSCQFDLGDFADGVYSIAVRASDGTTHPFGRESALRHAELAGTVAGRKGAGGLKVAGSTFARGDAHAHASLFVDIPGSSLRLRISDRDDIDAFLRGAGGAAQAIRFSIVSPVYNVEKYLDTFFQSITSQSIGLKSRIELIMVDDGSTDRSGKIIKRWQKQFPANIRYIHQPNGGLSSARNRGLAEASHEWITFIDPDDFVDSAYFAEVDAAIRRHGEARVAMVSCNPIFHFDETSTTVDTHPLRFRFADGEMAVPADNLGRYIQLSAATAFFRGAAVAAAGLTFDARIRPSFEDAHLVGRYLLSLPGRTVIFLPQAKYFYRRRNDATSLNDRAGTDPQWYGDQLQYGCLDLLKSTAITGGMPPRQIQDTVLYELSWRFLNVVDRPEAVAFLGESGRRRLAELLTDIFAMIEASTIVEDGITPLPFAFRVGILGRFKDIDPPQQLVEVADFDRHRRLVRLVYWTRGRHPSVSFLYDGAPVAPAFAKTRRRDFLGSDFVFEHIVWLPADDRRLTVLFDGAAASLRLRGRLFEDGLPPGALHAAFAERGIGRNLPDEVRQLRDAARSPSAATAFRRAWVFMDRDNEADDSAEHLYRYVREKHPEINAFFVLRPASPDWDRLKADGFRLITFDAPEHALALLNADFVISSHADSYVHDRLPRRFFGDLIGYRFVFLQHGIIKDDISGWLNAYRIDRLITSTPREFKYVAGDGPFVFSRKEVVLTGLPRHDALLRSARGDARTMVIMPTWRLSLAGEQTGAGNERTRNRDFAKSEYARRWKGFLNAPRLHKAAAATGHRLVFVAHREVEPYLDVLDPPPQIEVRRFGGEPISPLFQTLSLFVTDFTSKAFDVAYLGKAVIYYQFDEDVFLGGGHISRPGYFDYARDGFGPVFREEEELVDAIEAFLNGAPPDPVYRRRADETFVFRDGRCCERVFDAIVALDRPAANQADRDA